MYALLSSSQCKNWKKVSNTSDNVRPLINHAQVATKFNVNEIWLVISSKMKIKYNLQILPNVLDVYEGEGRGTILWMICRFVLISILQRVFRGSLVF